MDRVAIRGACRTVPSPDSIRRVTAGPEAVRHPEYFAEPPELGEVEFYDGPYFRFRSPVETDWAENNTVFGRRFNPRKGPSDAGGAKGPAVILIHGWNGEHGYRYIFPFMGRRFAALGLTVVMIELPYHGSRKPRSGPVRNFLSGDLEHMMHATRQAVADIRSTIGWLRGEGYGRIGLWGNSLGAWLGGLVGCVDERLDASVLVTPVPRIDQAIDTLAFCRHIRASMEGRDLSAAELNLTFHRPKQRTEDILLVESLYDLFAPAESIEELWEAWGHPEIWRVKHGHISVLVSPSVIERSGRWLKRRLAPSPARSG